MRRCLTFAPLTVTTMNSCGLDDGWKRINQAPCIRQSTPTINLSLMQQTLFFSGNALKTFINGRRCNLRSRRFSRQPQTARPIHPSQKPQARPAAAVSLHSGAKCKTTKINKSEMAYIIFRTLYSWHFVMCVCMSWHGTERYAIN